MKSVGYSNRPFDQFWPEVEGTLGHAAIIDLLKEVDGNGDGVIDFQVWMVFSVKGTIFGQVNAVDRVRWRIRMMCFFFVFLLAVDILYIYFLETLGITTSFWMILPAPAIFFKKGIESFLCHKTRGFDPMSHNGVWVLCFQEFLQMMRGGMKVPGQGQV